MTDLSTLDASPPSTSGPSPRRRWLLIGGPVAVLAVIVALVVVLTGGDDEPVATSDQTTTSVEPTTTDEATTTIDEATSTTAAPTTTSVTEPTPTVDGEIAAQGDLDGDGRDEVFARAPMGAYTDGISVYTVSEDGSTEPVILNETPAVFAVGASVRHSAGLRCDGQTHVLRVYAGESADGQTYAVTWRDLRLANGTLTEVGTGSGTAHMGDALFTAAGSFDSSGL